MKIDDCCLSGAFEVSSEGSLRPFGEPFRIVLGCLEPSCMRRNCHWGLLSLTRAVLGILALSGGPPGAVLSGPGGGPEGPGEGMLPNLGVEVPVWTPISFPP